MNGGKSPWLKLAALVAVLAVILIAGRLLPVRAYIAAFLDALQGFGPAGLVVLSLAYILACVLFLPGSLLTIGAGVLAAALWPGNTALAVLWGTVAVSAGSVLGATAAFVLGRTLMRGWVAERVRDNPKFQALDRAIGGQGLKMVFLVRLSPAFPFNLLNYALGVTAVRLRDYVFASWLGMLPATVLYVYLGAAGAQLAGTPEKGLGQWALLAAGLAATVALVVVVTRTARRALAGAASLETEE